MRTMMMMMMMTDVRRLALNRRLTQLDKSLSNFNAFLFPVTEGIQSVKVTRLIASIMVVNVIDLSVDGSKFLGVMIHLLIEFVTVVDIVSVSRVVDADLNRGTSLDEARLEAALLLRMVGRQHVVESLHRGRHIAGHLLHLLVGFFDVGCEQLAVSRAHPRGDLVDDLA